MGKSTTAQMFREAGCPVFDADKQVHGLYEKNGAMVPIIKSVFPDSVSGGVINRQKLGEHMRADALHLKVLESFVHPMVAGAREEFLETHSDAEIVVMDVPLLFETGGESYVDHIVVVTAPAKLQRERVLARPNVTEALFESLLARQMSDADKRKKADSLIFTDKGLESAREQVHDLLSRLRAHGRAA